MTHTIGGIIDAKFFARYDATVQAALKSESKPYVIVDLVRRFIISIIRFDYISTFSTTMLAGMVL